jgi:hypothetical protein
VIIGTWTRTFRRHRSRVPTKSRSLATNRERFNPSATKNIQGFTRVNAHPMCPATQEALTCEVSSTSPQYHQARSGPDRNRTRCRNQNEPCEYPTIPVPNRQPESR